ncbi:fatty acyl-CoA reductase wat-like [Photinus pyralis]|uniref:fatty acyl-CoA reductase wat-like n=1 Tax=Photinus pyralis TaxID=7054 RepID=UPI001266FE01|nr:fatty acyl-CoA reductase wat-like [Photinus pyralis]
MTMTREGGDITYADMVQTVPEKSKIAQYFSGGHVFVTGATGFLGKLITEKLLRSCGDLEKLYLLIREKKGKKVADRGAEIFDNVIFEQLKNEQPKFMEKVVLVAGDCIKPELGLGGDDRETLLKNVTCVFHCAATVKFDEKIRTAAYINVRATRDLVNMAKQMINLKSFIYISTAYAHCCRKDIQEVVYETPITGEKLLTLVDTCSDDFLNKVTPTLLGEWPNTYVFTKAVAEEVVGSSARGLPIAIVRPSIVVATAKGPLAGWIDNMYGVTGITVGIALGLIRTLHCKKDCVADIVPADYVINSAIAAAWSIGNKESMNKEITNDNSEVSVFNYVCSTQTTITWRVWMEYSKHYLKQVPSPLQLWHHFFILNSNYFMHVLCVILFHYIPAYVVDFLALCIGKQPLLVKGYQKVGKFTDVISYFAVRQWDFTNQNTQSLYQRMSPVDKETFGFDLREFDWDSYFYSFARGGRVYLLKDPIDTLPQGRVKYYKLLVMHYALVAFVCAAFLGVCFCILKLFL